MEKKKRKINIKFWLKLILIVVLVIIIVYTFGDSGESIMEQIRQTAVSTVLFICISSVIYHFFEGWITFSLARRYNPNFKFRWGQYCAFFCSFYRLSTLGSGQGVAAIVFLGKRGVEYSEAIGLYLVQYVLHKVSIALFSGIFLVLNWSVMIKYFKPYMIYLAGAYILTLLITIGLILLCVWPTAHKVILFLVHKVNFGGRLDGAIKQLEKSSQIMLKSTSDLLTDVKSLIGIIVRNLIKLAFWYCIPYLTLISTHGLTLLDSLSVTSLSVMTAAVIPTPAGIGSVELVMGNLLSVLLGEGTGAAITLLYRAATFVLPFLIGGVLILVEKVFIRYRKKPILQ